MVFFLGLALEPNPNPESSSSSPKREGFFLSLLLAKDCLGKLVYFFFENPESSSSSSKSDFLPVFLGGSLLIAGIGGTDPEFADKSPVDFGTPKGPPRGPPKGVFVEVPPKGLTLGGILGTSSGSDCLTFPPKGLDYFLGTGSKGVKLGREDFCFLSYSYWAFLSR